MPMEMRPGDWECPKCRDVQFARNTHCRKCDEPKPRDLPSPPRGGGGGGGRRSDTSPGGRELCGDFKRNNCFRDTCRFSHGGASRERGGGGGGGRGRSRDRGHDDRRGRSRSRDRRRRRDDSR
eukprot:TRINITY_DN2344_c0_g1_i3.p4 TRINITY_DN2344_c0_g1~~TRINITY_DN2344_c0_g1_i3.p4  ORF type:complete len:123 (+),score=24.77 TRINITY_DN2344_c0_g1_i3:91-459(+)